MMAKRIVPGIVLGLVCSTADPRGAELTALDTMPKGRISTGD